MKCNHIKVKTWYYNDQIIWGYCNCGKRKNTVSIEACQHLKMVGEDEFKYRLIKLLGVKKD